MDGIARRYRQSQIKTATAVNVEMLKFYWSLGADIVRAKGFIDHKCYVCPRDSLHRSPESYRRIRFTHSGNADMFVDIVGCTVALKQHLGSFPGDQDYEPTDELVKFVLKS